jgi:RsmE family RNA methyltransferase
MDRMEIPPPVTLGKLLEEPRGFLLFLDEEVGIQPIQEVLSSNLDSPLALIGPEGGWSERERSMVTEFEKGGKGARVGLGSLIFPGRVAPVVAASVLSYRPVGRRSERGW